MTRLTVSLPGQDLVISWNHPWRRIEHRGLHHCFMKLTQCFISEFKGLRCGVDGKEKPFVRHIADARVKWPLLSLDGTKGHTARVNGDALSKNKARKIALKRALAESTFTVFERTRIWHAYLAKFEPGITLPPTIPPTIVQQALFGERNPGVADREVVPARILPFHIPITDPARILGPGPLILSPGSDQVH